MELVCLAAVAAQTSHEAIGAIARALVDAGCVKPSFEVAAIARERRSPTGLPFEPDAVALPHAEPEHVERAAVAIATLLQPVAFRQMGSPNLS